MNFPVYPILFLVLGTLAFGLAFPVMIAFIGLLFAFLVIFIVLRLLRGGSTFTVYTSRTGPGREDGREASRRRVYRKSEEPARAPRGEYINVAADDAEMEEAVETVELPATALSKEDEDGKENGGPR